MKNKGFTLIELLVVIAIIGILSSVVLASLNSARSKGEDAQIKASLANMRAQAELFYDEGKTYYGLCDDDSINAVKAIADFECKDTEEAGTNEGWAMSAPLKSVADTWFCVDATGVATTTSATASGITCN